jgi:hypothetical protein
MRNKNWKSVIVRKDTLEFLKTLKKNKGFGSLDELIFAAVKCVEFYSRGQILILAEIHAKSAVNDEKIKEELGLNNEKVKKIMEIGDVEKVGKAATQLLRKGEEKQ